MQKIKYWFRRDSIGVWVLILVIMIPALAIDSSQSRLPKFFRYAALAVMMAGLSKWWRRCLAFGLITVLSITASTYYEGSDRVMRRVSLTPLQNAPVIAEPVILGGDAMWYSEFDRQTTRQIKATICFYTDDGWGAAVAHTSDVPKNAWVTIPAGKPGITAAGRVVEKSELGLILSEIQPPGDRERISIAHPNEIEVGDEAVVHVLEDDLSLTVVGFIDRAGVQQVVLRSPSQEYPIVPGMSGSPVTQNGKIVAFLAATANFKDQFVYAPLATDVYLAMSRIRSQE